MLLPRSAWILMVLSRLLLGTHAQIATGQSDRSQQELAMLGWSAGVQTAYCQQMAVEEMEEPFREAIARMLNRHCRNAALCGLKKSVSFSKYQVILLDGYPRREHRTLHFRFFVVLPHDAVIHFTEADFSPCFEVPRDSKRPDKPLLSSQMLSEMLDAQIAEISHGMGWQVLSRERYPRFDPTTTFFNRWLILIVVIAGLCMFFLAYWTSAFTSGSHFYAEGWLVRGSSGGKNAALKRTMEIIEEQKYRFALYDSQRQGIQTEEQSERSSSMVVYKSKERVKEMHAPFRALATSYSVPQTAESNRASPMPMRILKRADQEDDEGMGQDDDDGERKEGNYHELAVDEVPANAVRVVRSQLTKTFLRKRAAEEFDGSSNQAKRAIAARQRDNELAAKMEDAMPKIVVMHTMDSSQESRDSGPPRVAPGHRRPSRTSDELLKRKKFLFGKSGAKKSTFEEERHASERKKQWRASSIVLSKISGVGMGRKTDK